MHLTFHTFTKLFCLLLVCTFGFGSQLAKAQCGDSIDLSTWILEGNAANGNWTVTNGGNTVNQSINGDPTFYVSPDSFINVIITGDIQVATTGDNDWVGFVFGYSDPDSLSPNNYDFYLFDWKQEDQNFGGYFGPEGYSLSKVEGVVTNFPQAFSSKTAPQVTLIESNYGNTLGWNDLQTYSFALTYTNTRAVISIDGDTIFDVFGCFTPGRFGFYNYSQSNVNYSNFSYRVAAAFEVITPDVCIGDSAYFLALSDSCENGAGQPVNNTITGWYWEFGDGNTSTDTNASHLYTSPGTYEVKLVVTDYLGCTDTAISSVDVFNIATELAPDTNICAEDSVLLDAGTNAEAWLWSTGDTTQTIFANAAGEYKVSVTGGFNCLATDSITIGHLSAPVVALGSDTSICPEDSLVLDAFSAGSSYLWSNGATSDTIVANTTGQYMVTVTSSAGCDNADTLNLVVYAAPTLSVDSAEVCNGDTVMLTVSGASTYAWSPAAGLSATTGDTVFSFTTVDTSYTIVGIDANSCRDTTQLFVDAHALPTATLSGGASICIGDTLQLSVTLTGEAPWSYTYTRNAGDTTTRSGITNPTDSFLVTMDGTYSIFSVTDANCTDDANSSLTSVNFYPQPTVDLIAVGSDSICLGDSVLMKATGTNTIDWFPLYNITPTSGFFVHVFPTVDTTYYAIGTSDDGCVDSASIDITVLPLPVLGIAQSSGKICLNDTVQLIASGANSYTWERTITGSAFSGDTIYDAPPGATDYILTGTDIFGCTDTTSTSVLIDTLPTLVLTPSDTTICKFDTAQLTIAGAVSYLWFPASSLSDSIGDTVTAFPTDTAYYTITGTDGNGCSSTVVESVNVFDLPEVQIQALNGTICFNDIDTLIATGATSYQWLTNYNISSFLNDTVFVNPAFDTAYVVRGTDDNSCRNTDTISVFVDTLPTITLSTPADSICLFDTTAIQAGGALLYTWTNTPGLSSYIIPAVNAYPQSTTNFVVTGIDNNGCVNTNDTTITVIDLPSFSVSPDPGALCVGDTIELTTSTSVYDYTWSPAALVTTDGNNADTVVSFATDTTEFTIYATDFFGCLDSGNYSLAVTPLPILTVTAANPFTCPGLDNQLMVTGGTSYLWSPNIAIDSIGSSTPIVSPDSTQRYYVTGTGPGGCQTTDSIDAQVFAVIPYSAGENDTMCRSDQVQLNASGGVSYLWQPSSGLSDSTLADPICTSLISRTYTVVITDANGCINEEEVFVKVHPLPSADAGEDTQICSGNETAIGTPPTGFEGTTYQWSPTTGLNDATLPQPIASPSSSTTYTLLVTDSNTCQSDDDLRVEVNPLPVLGEIEHPDYLCFGDTGLIRATIVSGGIEIYDWSPGIGLATPGADATEVSLLASQNYTLLVTDTNGCQTETDVFIEVKPLPEVSIDSVIPYCELDSQQVNVVADPGKYQWSPAEVFEDPTVVPATMIALKTTWIQLSVVDAFGCENNDRERVTVYPVPYADAGPDIENCDLQIVELGAAVTTDPENSVRWEPASLLDNPRAFNPSLLSTTVDTFTLTVTSPEGCKTRDTTIVNSDCAPALYAPNTFTPDGDGKNEVFLLFGNRIADFTLQIFDRNSRMIFESKDINLGWDGSYHSGSGAAPIGVYFWRANYTDENGRALYNEGAVNLIR